MSELLDLARRVAMTAHGDEQVEVCISRGRRTSVKAFGGEVESFTSAESFGLGIRIIADHREGFAHAGSIDDDVVEDTLAEARDNVGFGEPDDCYGLAEPDGVDVVEQQLWHEAVVSFPEERKIEIALELERRVRDADPRISGVRTATFGDGWGESAIATSTGLAIASRATSCHASVSAMAEADGETTIAAGVDAAREPDELDLDRVVGDAVERATRLLGARPVPSTRLAIVLEPRLAATFLGIVGGTLSGERVVKGRSPFADRVGEQIAAPGLTFLDDPTDPRSLAADSHDGEGLAARRNVLIDGGTLPGFLHNAYSARRAGTTSTASAVRGARSTPGVGCLAPAVVPGEGTLDELVAGIDHGLLVQSMTGLHSGVNAVSGDFSVGAEGLLIRDGAVAEPVREITIASTIQRMLLDIRAVGADLEWLPSGSGAVTLVIGDVALSGS